MDTDTDYNNREKIITKIIEYVKKFEKSKVWYKDAVKESYYKSDSIASLRYMLISYDIFALKYKEVKVEKEEKIYSTDKEEKPKIRFKKKKTKTMFIDDGEEKVLKYELPTILVREEKYNRWVNNCKTNKSGSSWCYLENNNNGRRKVRFYNDKLIYHNGGQWGLFKKVWTAPESTTQSNENVDNQ